MSGRLVRGREGCWGGSSEIEFTPSEVRQFVSDHGARKMLPVVYGTGGPPSSRWRRRATIFLGSASGNTRNIANSSWIIKPISTVTVMTTALGLLMVLLPAAYPEKISIGAIFEQGTDEVQSAFKFAMFNHNQNTTTRKFEFQAFVDVINTADAYKLSRLICSQFSRGVFSMLGAVSPDSFDTLHSYSNTFQMPFVTPWFPEKVLTPSSGLLDFAISMRPDYHRAIIDTVRYYGWKKIIYLYDSHDGSAKGSVNIDNRINRYWKGSVNRESNPGGTTEDLGCEPRCPNDTSAIKRGDRRSQSVQSRSHALLLPLLWIRTKQDPADLKYLLP